MANLQRGTRRITVAAVMLALLLAAGATFVLRGSTSGPTDGVGAPAPPHDAASSDAAPDAMAGNARDSALAARSGGPVGAVPRGTVNGRVVDAVTGQGIVGAIVVVESLRESSVQARATTTTDGAFALQGLRDGGYAVVVWHPHYRSPHWSYERWKDEGPPPDGAELRVPFDSGAGVWTLRLTQGPELRGAVVDEAGRGVGGAIVRVLWFGGTANSPGNFGWPTDADGSFVLRMGDITTMGAQAPGRRSKWVHVPDQPTRPLRVVLEREAIVRGEVRWSDGRPAAGVEVLASSDHSWVEDHGWDRTATNQEGRFELPLGPDQHRISAEYERPERWGESLIRTTAEVRLGPGEERSGLVLTLPTYSVLKLELLDAMDQPLPDEPITMTTTPDARDADDDPDPRPHRKTTDARGRTAFALPLRGKHTLTHDRAGESPVVLWQGEVPPDDPLRCRSSPSVRTRLQVRAYTSAGDVIPTFLVVAACKRQGSIGMHVFMPEARTLARDGVAALEVLGTPPLVLFAEQRDAHGDPVADPLRTREFEVHSLPPDGLVRVWLATPDQVVGLVVAEEATPAPAPTPSPSNATPASTWRPVEGVRIEQATKDNERAQFVPARHATTDAEGRFALDFPRSLSKGYLRAVAPVGWVAEEPVDPWARSLRQRSVTLRLRRAGRLEGRLRVKNDVDSPAIVAPSPWPGSVRVSTDKGEEELSPSEGDDFSTNTGEEERSPWEWNGVARVGADGRWALDDAPVSIALYVHIEPDTAVKAGFVPPEPVRVPNAGGPPVVIDLVPAATIRGRVRRADGTPIIAAEVWIEVNSAAGRYIPHDLRWGPEGRFEIVGLPHAPVRLLAGASVHNSTAQFWHTGQWRWERWVGPGTSDIDLVAPPLGAVSIRIAQKAGGSIRVRAWAAGTTTLCGWYNVEIVNGLARLEGVPADRDLVFSIQMGSAFVATCGPLRAGGSAIVTPSRAGVFFVENPEHQARYRAALGRLFAVAPHGTWEVNYYHFRPQLLYYMFERGPDEPGPPPGRYDLVELLPNGETTVLARDLEARVPERNPNDMDFPGDDDDDDR